MNETILNIFSEAKTKSKNYKAFKVKKNKVWKSIDWHTYFDTTNKVSHCLKEMGLQKGDKACIISNTCYEWVLSDVSIMACGGVTVPIYQNSLEEDIEYIINNCQAKFIFCETEQTAKKLMALNCPSLKQIITYSKSDSTKIKNFADMTNFELANEDNYKKQLKAITPEDVATIIYTSGTTGRPKGVVLTHEQIYSEIYDLFSYFTFDHSDTCLCFLPLAHVMGRIESLGNIHKGYTIAFAESVEALKKNLSEVKPTFLIAVPRIFEKIYNGILNQINTKKLTVKLFNWASAVGQRVSHLKVEKKSIPLPLALQYNLAQKLIFNKIKMALGGEIKLAISGGAPLEKKISEFFHAANILILEGYGLTETTAAVCANTEFDYRFGTVGKPAGDAEIKIAEDGEILVRSKKVMKEYYNNPEATAEVFDQDRFFKTGDIGEFTKDGFLKITDRKKDLIKTAAGKYVAPQKLENLLKISPMISNVLIHGDRKKYIVALVTLDPDYLINFAKTNEISYSSAEQLSQNKRVYAEVKSIVAEANSNLARFETIKSVKVLPRDFTIESGELTPSLKLKRKHCDKKFEKEILSLYGLDKSSL